MNNKIKFIASAMIWTDRKFGNTYHSLQITNTETGETIYCSLSYGYSDMYRQTALKAMHMKGWIPSHYGEKHANGSDYLCMYERENDYPIYWITNTGTKKECVEHGKG